MLLSRGSLLRGAALNCDPSFSALFMGGTTGPEVPVRRWMSEGALGGKRKFVARANLEDNASKADFLGSFVTPRANLEEFKKPLNVFVNRVRS